MSIIDLSEASNQPFISDDVVIAYNGGIYNFIEPIEELKKKGYNFRTSGDTEVIIKVTKNTEKRHLLN